MTSLHIDIETYCEIDLKKAGAYRYAEEAEIILLAYAYNDEPVSVVDLLAGEQIPPDVFYDFNNPRVIKKAFNAAFERSVMQAYFNLILPADQWQCTQARTAMCGLPLNLGQAAEVLNLDIQKDKNGAALIRYFCIPIKKPIKKNDFRERNLHNHDAVKWEQFKEYNKMDVEAERAIDRALSFYPISEFEHRQWQLDQKINERGVTIDIPFVRNAISLVNHYENGLLKEFQEITGIDKPSELGKLKMWLFEETGEEVDKLNKETIPEIIKSSGNDKIGRALQIRKDSSKTSTKKYFRMIDAVCKDGRVRGLHEYYGANRTGRAAGRLLQHQNLPAGDLEDEVETARSVAMLNDPEWLEYLFGPIPNTLSSLIRSALVPTPGHRFIICDYTSIEAVVLAWLAGETWVLDLFRNEKKPKLYEATASQMFNVPLENIDKKSPYRKKGKVAVLACIAKDSLVLTDKGLVPIQDVKLHHKLWDGNSWVSHKGVIFSGIKHTLSYGGLTATEDHLVWVEGKRDPIRFKDAAASGARLLQSGNRWEAIRVGQNYIPREKMEQIVESRLRINGMHQLRETTMDVFEQSNKRKIQRMPTMFSTTKNTEMVRETFDSSKTKMPKPERPELSHIRRERNRVPVSVRYGSRPLPNGFIPQLKSQLRVRSSRQSRALRKGKFAFYYSETKLRQQEHNQITFLESRRMALRLHRSSAHGIAGVNPRRNHAKGIFSCNTQKKKLERDQSKIETFDILDCGPHNRFTVSDVLVHNCGYQGGVGALINMGALKEGLTEEELPAIVAKWREANSSIVGLWYCLQEAAIAALKTGQRVPVHAMRGRNGYTPPNLGIEFYVKGRSLFFKLPSGRELVYVSASLEEGEYGPKIVYYGIDQIKKRWTKLDTYGGKLTENLTQAVARDLLMNGLQNLDKAGYNIVLHVHDEAVCEMPVGVGSLEEVNHLMITLPEWAPGLPLKAAGEESFYYKK